MKFKRNKIIKTTLEVLVILWIIICLYSLAVLKYVQNPKYQEYLLPISPKIHIINMKYYEFLYPLTYQDYIWTK